MPVGDCVATNREKLPVEPLKIEMVIFDEASKVILRSWSVLDSDETPEWHTGSKIASPLANVT